MPDFIGQNIGRYHIIEKLGEGGMAVVYKAYDTRLERDVAIKIIRTEMFGPAILDSLLKRFEREAKSLARMQHPNILHINDYGEHENTPYLVMDYLPGGTLKALTGRRMPYVQAARLLAPVARALEYAHQEGIIHRDVKPANILLTKTGAPMLSDFGIAKILETDQTTNLTGTGMGIGTPEYMSPEQWTGLVTPQADIYALGVIFYELVTGQRPYIADTPAAILIKVVHDPLPRPKEFVYDLPEEVEQVLFKALAKQPEDRYANMGEFGDALEKLAAGILTDNKPIEPRAKDTLAAPIPSPASVSKAVPATIEVRQAEKAKPAADSSESVTSVELPRPAKPRWLPLVGAAMILVALLAASLWAWQKSKNGAAGSIPPASPTSVVLALNPILPAGASDQPTRTLSPSSTTAPVESISTNIPATATHTSLQPTSTATSQPSPTKKAVDLSNMVLIQASEFQAGCDPSHNLGSPCEAPWDDPSVNTHPSKAVTLGDFYIDKFEVSNADYAECVKERVCSKPKEVSSESRKTIAYYGNPQYASYPVIYVDHSQATDYCHWVGKRLPTELEWEKAARGTDQRIFPWGDYLPSCATANIDGGSYSGEFKFCSVEDTSEVTGYRMDASPYGVQNMAGNVMEFVEDSTILKGGSFRQINRYFYEIRIAYHTSNPYPNFSSTYIGFRCAYTP